MSVTFDDRDLREMAKHLKGAPEEVAKDVEQLLTKYARRAVADARRAAPKDRPWLSTTEGIVVRKPRKLVRRIVSPLDPDGESVGYRLEYGTSTITPRPFVGPAVAWASVGFNADALDVLVKRTI